MLRSILIISLFVLQVTIAQCPTPVTTCSTPLIFTSGLLDSVIKDSGVYPAVKVTTTGFNPPFTGLTNTAALIISDEDQISGTVANQKRYYSRIIDITCLPKYAFVACKSSSPSLTKLYINGILYPDSARLCVDKNSASPTFPAQPAMRLSKHFLIGKNIIEWEVSNGINENKLTNPIGLVYEIKIVSA